MRSQMLKRLIWKETRESLLVAGVGFVAPALILLALKTKFKLPDWSFIVLVLAAVMGTFLWAAEKANAKQNRNDFEDAYLVLPRSIDWLASYLFPALLSFAIGAWLGYVLSCMPHWSEAHWSHTQLWTVLTSGLYMLAGFLVSYAASSAFGLLAGVIISIVWLMFPGTPLIATHINKAIDESAIFVGLIARTVVGAAAGSLFVAAVSRTRLRPKLRAIPLIVAVLSCFGPLIPDPAKIFPGAESSYLNYAAVGKSSSDGSLVVAPTGKSAGMSASLKLASLRTGAAWVRSFRQAVQPIALTGQVAYLAQQSLGERCVRILAWDAATGEAHCVARMRVGKDAILDCRSGFASPDGRLLTLCLGAAIGDGCDLWAVNTTSGRYRLLAPNTSMDCPPVQWTSDRAILSMDGEVVYVDMTDLGRHAVRLPFPTEVQR